MREIIIGIDTKGNPYLKSCPKKCSVKFVYDRKPTFKKRIKTLWYNTKKLMGAV
jgi:hypothetical protein